MKGVDFSWGRPNVAAMAKDGVKFAFRYLCYDTSGKRLSKYEANNLLAHGISPVSNWEEKAGDMLGGYSRGVTYAKEANRQHLAYGGPPEAPIYFSVDIDASDSQLGTCYDFLRGAASVLGWNRLGCYGGYRTIEYMARKNPRPRYFWQTLAWSGGRWSTHAHVRQYRNNVQYMGALVDHNTAMVSDFGQWTLFTKGNALSNSLIGLSRGAKGEAVKALQYMLRRAGFDGQTTGEYDAQTATRVRDMRRSQGTQTTGGDTLTAAAYEQLMYAIVQRMTS